MRLARSVAALSLALMAATAAFPQSASTPAESSLPEPYRAGEFPPWLDAARRFEIVGLGVFPILLFYTRFASDAARYVRNGFDATYAPWPFKNEQSYEPSDDEQWKNVLTAAGLSVAFAALDALVLWRVQLE
ncbi:MAG TPA: hypothetical protein PLQ29_05460 [Spirochaetales bacterium]|nr:hypothetical protein [Spirochaetales bacterium]HPG86129.1 hypothetical protein [Spirochaetales bacterium]HPM73021.1 hypothetical protein [Spirochaetales bacterium]